MNLSKVWLILDANYLCYRAYHTTGTLSHNDIMTGVIYGYLRACADLVDEFRACSVIHCFDHGINKRLAILPGYKQSRRDRFAKMAPEEKKLKAELERQITLLKTQYLTELGYKNVFYADGFESDDIMAKVAACHMNMPPNRGIIVTGDADLYQVVRGRVRMHDPRKQLTYTERGS